MKYKMLFSVLIAMILLVSTAFSAYQVGDTVTDFTLPDADGNSVQLYDYYGMVVLINFWASW